MTIIDEIDAADRAAPTAATNFNAAVADPRLWRCPQRRDQFLKPLHDAAAAAAEVDLEAWQNRIILGIGRRILPIALRRVDEQALADACQQAQSHRAMAEAAWAAIEAFEDPEAESNTPVYLVSDNLIDALADIANTCEDVADGRSYESERAGDAVLHVAKGQWDLDDEEPRDPSPQGVLEEACRIAMEAYQAEGLVEL